MLFEGEETCLTGHYVSSTSQHEPVLSQHAAPKDEKWMAAYVFQNKIAWPVKIRPPLLLRHTIMNWKFFHVMSHGKSR